MGLTTSNPLLTGVSGKIGNLLIKQYSYGTVITVMPTGSNKKKKPTPLQKLHRDMFAEAVKHAKALQRAHRVKHGPGKAEERKALYYTAVKEFIAQGRKDQRRGEFFETEKKEAKKSK